MFEVVVAGNTRRVSVVKVSILDGLIGGWHGTGLSSSQQPPKVNRQFVIRQKEKDEGQADNA